MYLLFDIGGTKMRLAVTHDRKSFLPPQIVPTPDSFDEGINTFKSIARVLIAQQNLQVIAQQHLQAIVGGLAGVFDSSKSFLTVAPHMKDWTAKPLKQILSDTFNVPIILENDAALAGLGEANFGAGMGHKIVAYLTISTGVGGARIVDGKLDVNYSGFEPGHQIITFGGNVCPGCTSLGHLEAYVSGTAVENLYHAKPDQIQDPAIWEGAARWLAVGLHNTTVFWSPNIIVLGGSMMKSIPLERVQFYFKETSNIFSTPPKIALSKLGDQAGLYGALAYLNQAFQPRGGSEEGSRASTAP